MINSKQIQDIQKILQYKFIDIENLKSGLTHPGIGRNNKKSVDKYTHEFERLEFLGDRVLGLVIASLIFKKFKEYNEGNLSKKFSFLVQREFLYKIALEINLSKFLAFNKGKNKVILNKSILADSFESLIGAMFIDGGYTKTYSFIKRIWSPHLNNLSSEELDPKSKLQEITQKISKKLPKYTLIKKEGLPHSPKFTISLNVLSFENIEAKGNSIREAQKKAANKVLSLLDEK